MTKYIKVWSKKDWLNESSPEEWVKIANKRYKKLMGALV